MSGEIHRLMVTGDFAMLARVDPNAVQAIVGGGRMVTGWSRARPVQRIRLEVTN